MPVSSPTKSSVSPALFLSVALLAGAALGFEVALTRVFATLLRYQFAFLVVSLALCGIGLGGLYAHKRPRLDLGNTAAFFGVSVAASLGLILRGVFAIRPDQFWIAALLTLIPFAASGAFLSAIFARFSAQGGRLYAFDLAGAALAALLSVLVMQWLGAIGTCLLCGALGAFAGAFATKKSAFPLAIGAILLATVPLNARFNLWKVPAIPPRYETDPVSKERTSLADRGVTQPLFTELGDASYGSKIVDTRWNAFARTDVVTDPQSPDSFLLYTNGNVPTNMMKWDGHLWTIPPIAADFPLSDWTFKSANLRGQNVLSIGPGGGLDALLALRYGAKSFDGAEINPSIIELMREPKYRAFNGDIYGQPGVHVQTAEGRAFVREAAQSGKRYRLIFSALTKTATAGQGTALLESFIYTSDAFNDYLGALDEDGEVAIVGDAPRLLARLFSTATAHFKAQGLSEREAGTHLSVMFFPQPGPYQWALIVRKNPFPAAQTAQMLDDARARQLFPIWLPDRAASDQLFSIPFGSLGSGALSLDGFINAGRKPREQDDPNGATTTVPGVNFAPCPDDRPFVLDMGLSPFTIFSASPSLSILLGLSVLSTLGFAVFLLGRGPNRARNARSTLYFLCLGVGFILVEIPIIQKLTLPLGYPTLSLSVILFSLLLGGGAGAGFSQRYDGKKLRAHAQKCALGVALGAVLFGALSASLSAVMLSMPLFLRCIVAALALLPLGFLLGTPFPSGLRLLESDEPATDTRESDEPETNADTNADTNAEKVPLIWALNGTASVAGTLAAAVLAKGYGFSAVLTVGAAIYLVAAALLARKSGG